MNVKQTLRKCVAVVLLAPLTLALSDNVDAQTNATVSYPLVDTGQTTCYDNSGLIECPAEGEAFYGQDAQFTGNTPSYTDNGDGTVTDNVTGLIWAQDQLDQAMDWSVAPKYCESLILGGITDWRVPNIKELWSIRDFSTGWPWVDTDYFNLVSEDGFEGAQQHTWSSNYYLVDTEEAVDNVAWIVNDWTGHIKALPGRRYARCVSGDTYGTNNFIDNGDSTVTDNATGLMWAQNDSGEAMDWEAALAYAENSTYAGYDDWRLPNVKELQSIADYSGVFPAIDSIFNISEITNEAGNADYAYVWTGTSNPYIDPRDEYGYWYAWYVAFGYAVGTDGNDIHGAGAVRFDTKAEGGATGPDGERYYNYVRLVRDGWINLSGSISYGDIPVCALALANGQHMFSCGENDGQYSLDVPLDDNGQVTLFGFADGFAPFSYTLTPSESTTYDVSMSPASSDEAQMSVAATTQAVGDSAYARVFGNADFQGIPVCALVLANGQNMFSCDGMGSFDLTVPLDVDGQITLFGFADGFASYKQTLEVLEVTEEQLDISRFADGALSAAPAIVECILSDGTTSTCYEIVTAPAPAGQSAGPFCPRTTITDASEAGIWLDGSGTVHDLDGNFIVNLPNLYGTSETDQNWILYDELGNVRVTDTQEACEAAAVPDVDEAYQQYCVECSLEDVGGGVSHTYLIPVTPVPADTNGAIRLVGVALNGAQLAGPAPVDAILGNYTIAAFDDCGGHINPFEGYHYHAATGCTEIGEQSDGHAGLIGYALDGYGIYGEFDAEGNDPGELDECRGQTDEVRGYHYHAASPGENMFIGCFHGLTANQNNGGGTPNGPPAPAPGR